LTAASSERAEVEIVSSGNVALLLTYRKRRRENKRDWGELRQIHAGALQHGCDMGLERRRNAGVLVGYLDYRSIGREGSGEANYLCRSLIFRRLMFENKE
jgi:hypothetical protein